MTLFPTRDAWSDAVWPELGLFRTLVVSQGGEDLLKAAKAAEDFPDKTFMLLVEDFDLFNREIPDQWRRMPPDGGIPRNVWVGAAFTTNEELDERAPRLLGIKARRLFLVAKKNHETPDCLDHHLEPWRCMHCGRRGFVEVPEVCPTGRVCEGYEELIMPQITWLVDMDRDKECPLTNICKAFKVALWDGASKEVPE